MVCPKLIRSLAKVGEEKIKKKEERDGSRVEKNCQKSSNRIKIPGDQPRSPRRKERDGETNMEKEGGNRDGIF